MSRLHKFLSLCNDVPLRAATPNVAGLQHALTPILLASPLLPTLSVLQSSLDPLDIEGLEKTILHRTSCTTLDEALASGALGEQPTTDEWIAWRDNWLSTTTPAADRDLRSLVMAYLLSATLKDCSIFVRLQLVNGMGPPDVVIKAIDLDPKPIGRLSRYRQLDKEIVDNFRQFLASAEGEVRRCKS
jgi:inositol-pentakisphosphate 2-kinase